MVDTTLAEGTVGLSLPLYTDFKYFNNEGKTRPELAPIVSHSNMPMAESAGYLYPGDQPLQFAELAFGGAKSIQVNE